MWQNSILASVSTFNLVECGKKVCTIFSLHKVNRQRKFCIIIIVAAISIYILSHFHHQLHLFEQHAGKDRSGPGQPR